MTDRIRNSKAVSNGQRQQQPRALKTRREILTASAATFDVEGYAAATVNAIATQSNLSKGALYFHFASKEAIARQLIADWSALISQVFLCPETISESPISQLRSSFADLAHHLENDQSIRAGMKLTLDPSIENAHAAYQHWVGIVRDLVDQGIRAGAIADTLSSRHLAWNLCAGFIGTVHSIEVLHDALDFRACTSEMLTAYLPNVSLEED